MRSRLAGLLAALALLAALLPLRAPAGEAAPVLLVFTSVDDARARAVVDTFRQQVDFAVQLSYDISGAELSPYALSDRLRGFRADLILAVGDDALAAVGREFLGAPVLYAEARPTRLTASRRDLLGIAPWPDPMTGVPRLAQAVPGLRRLGAVRLADTPEDDPWWRRLRLACETAGVELQLATAGGPEEAASAALGLARTADLLWLVDVPGLWNGRALGRVLQDAWERRLPVVGFDRRQLHAPAPAAMVLLPDPRAVGLAAAEVARQVLAERIPVEDLAVPRVESRLYGNRLALRRARLAPTARAAEAFDGWEDEE